MIKIITRDGDTYEREYLAISEVVFGYYCLGHRDKRIFLDEVLKTHPNVVIDTAHWGWWGRWKAGIERGWQPHRPTTTDIVHTYWRKYHGSLNRARPHTKGAFPVTYLPVEASANVGDLSDTYDEKRRGWTNHFYPELIDKYC